MMFPIITINSGQCLHRSRGWFSLTGYQLPAQMTEEDVLNRSTTGEYALGRCIGANLLSELLLHSDILHIVEQEFDLSSEIVRTKTSQHYQRDFAGS